MRSFFEGKFVVLFNECGNSIKTFRKIVIYDMMIVF